MADTKEWRVSREVSGTADFSLRTVEIKKKNDPVEDVSKDLANKIKIMNYLKQSQSQLKTKIYC